MKIIINGAAGRMGKVLRDIVQNAPDAEIAALIDRTFISDPVQKTFARLADFSGKADVIIDFSNHASAPELCEYAVLHKIPSVIATTGHTDAETAIIKEASGYIPVFLSYNMSLGIAYLASAAKKAAKMFPGAEIEIVETHHDKKLDVPSGTAIMLANSIKEAKKDAFTTVGRREYGQRDKNEIGIHSLRYGSVVGIHEVIISTGSQTITLKHEAHDRSLFAEGALAAAEFIKQKTPGIYTMKEFTEEN